ncbi:MAG: hypothetical protein COU33_04115 [Candidatus Magasanikbacteria bacterium CG10_big_fil_rev_8_21_14_0_10_43_6]|uniref:DoxX family protein n=1 Tax=Candidatus Magasanikbacteria bacterium CG10_big_fil_rev_8_21_14_0_10_43_6 TaxID=1974650 RepID=A0A2M6W0N0_9BACT|nr:MAG: hypothetical protein COU33_04115 [Candidatus Magasanikbacteria bacterium CG10_big_fil_rev_8_21_14_0_10_43_6]
MKKYFYVVSKVLLTGITITPIFGALGIFPDPARDMYTSDQAFNFISTLMEVGYIMSIMAFCFAATIILLWTRREAAAALLLLPFTVNIVAFHLFLDGGLLTAGAIMGNVLLLLNMYFLWQERSTYVQLLTVRSEKQIQKKPVS